MRPGEAHLACLLAARPPRARSLIVTAFGDALAPRRQDRARQPHPRDGAFRVNERLVRTAVLRLSRGLARSGAARPPQRVFSHPAGHRRVEGAGRRIYAAGAPRWDGCWKLVLSRRDKPLRRAVGLLGFGALDGPRAERGSSKR